MLSRPRQGRRLGKIRTSEKQTDGGSDFGGDSSRSSHRNESIVGNPQSKNSSEKGTKCSVAHEYLHTQHKSMRTLPWKQYLNVFRAPVFEPIIICRPCLTNPRREQVC